MIFFSKVKNPKNFWRPNSVSPHPGRGTLWYHMVRGHQACEIVCPASTPPAVLPSTSEIAISREGENPVLEVRVGLRMALKLVPKNQEPLESEIQ